MTAPLVIFDLDGTLIDTAPDLIDSLNHTIEAASLAPVTFDDLTHLVGQGVRVMIRRAFELRKTPLDEPTAERLFGRFMEHYEAHMPGKSRPYAGVVECLDRLSSAGMRFAICTNKAEQLAFPLIEKLGLSDRFAAITCGDTFSVRKPDARHIFGTIERAGGDPAASLMVGDSVNDILAARNAGIPSIAVSFGYSDVPVDKLDPDHVIGGYGELTADLVEKLMSREARLTAAAK
ncbi:phosphoglycolate phosphatase [Xaviernesmea oryzae]|uniref:Phosphoglycolate phosphatase n=1 Tax=Xaviernesmea oryzae TaxID=464029 RepID=A0A1X7GDU2_9HYPH|nr:HAD family hydrolase [Xaviernesmea oryzae]SMF68206.1 phosphoglycolate phosphatase [Xaviernesmea oryzae]